MSKSEAISVYARFRPTNEIESREGGGDCYSNISDDTVEIDYRKYTFDRIYPPKTPQATMYETIGKMHVEQALKGFNTTIIAYGQTGSGKTYTIEGLDILSDDVETKGLIPRIFMELIDTKLFLHDRSNYELNISISMVEIYKNKVYDLLKPGKALEINADKEGFYIKDIEKKTVNADNDMIEVFKNGSKNRKKTSTKMNDHSSRSHMVVMLELVQVNTVSGKKISSIFNIVDLAGSEKLGVSDDVDETKTISSSLSELGQVIKRLVDKAKPNNNNAIDPVYRNNALTMILKKSLNGNCKTSVILCCSPTFSNRDETMNSLRFGKLCKEIKNKVRKNIEAGSSELKAEIKRLQSELRLLQVKYDKLKGIEVNEEERDEILNNLNSQIESMNDLISEQKSIIERDETVMKQLKDENEKLMKEADKEDLENEVNNLNNTIEELKNQLTSYQEMSSNLNAKLKTYEINVKDKDEDIKRLDEEMNNNKSNYLSERDEFKKRYEEMNNTISLLNEQKADIEKMYHEKIIKIQDELSLNNLEDVLTESQIKSLNSSINENVNNNVEEDLEKNKDPIIVKIKMIMEFNKVTIQNNLKEIERLNEKYRELNDNFQKKEINCTELKTALDDRFNDIIKIKRDYNDREKRLLEKINCLNSQLSYSRQNYEKDIEDKQSVIKQLSERLNILKRQFRTRNIEDMSKSIYPTKTKILQSSHLADTNKKFGVSFHSLVDDDAFIPPVIKKNMAKLNNEIKNLNDEISRFIDEKEQDAKIIDILNEEKNELQTKLEGISNKMKEKNKEYEIERNELKNENANLKKVYEDVKMKTNDMKKDNDQLMKEKEDLKKEMKEKIKEYEIERNHLRIENEKANKNNVILTKQYNSKVHELANSISELNNIKHKYNSLFSENNQLKKIDADLHLEYNKKKMDCDSLKIEYDKLKRQIEIKENDIRRLNENMNEEINKKDKIINNLERQLEDERSREKVFIKSDYKEKYNNLSQQKRFFQDSVSKHNNGGLISQEMYDKLLKSYNDVCDEYSRMIILKFYDYDNFYLTEYLDGKKPSLFSGHLHPLTLDEEIRMKLMKEDLECDYILYFPSSIDCGMFSSEYIEKVFSNDRNIKTVHYLIEIFLSLIGFKLKNDKLISLATENRLFSLTNKTYQIAITQILKHLRETGQKKLQITIIKGLIYEINRDGPLNTRKVRQAFHDYWINLIVDKEQKTILRKQVKNY